MTNYKRHEELASKWLNGTISDAEKLEFAAWYNEHSDDRIELSSSFAACEEELKGRILAKVKENMQPKKIIHTKNYRFRRTVRIAAAILFVVFTGVYLWLVKGDKERENAQLAQHDVLPGGNRAILTLADGRTITLSSEQSGIVIGDEIRYEEGGVVAGFTVSPSGEDSKMQYNMITTPKGGQYQIRLSDGSRVWLNSASSLRYPTRFTIGKREVQLLEGEAYFEIAKQVSPLDHSQKTPFLVTSKHQTIEVLGTQFNVSAYSDEKEIKTTLVEGSVSIHTGPQTKMLAPGQQAVLTGDRILINAVDTEIFTAWKDGFFYFDDADIYRVMEQFERWYDIDVQYDIDNSEDLFVGKIPKAVKLSTALNVLRSAGVNFEIKDGRHLIVKSGK